MQFHDGQVIMPHDAPDLVFLAVWAVMLFLDTQKNSVRGKSSTMKATGDAFVHPVVASAHHYLHLHRHQAPPDTPICTYHTKNTPQCVNSHQITALLRIHVTKIGFQTLGFHPHEIETHSLCSGGATLHLADISDSTIKIVSRWRSDAFLIYLWVQITTFTKGVAATMAKVQWFIHTNAPHASLL